MSQNKVTNVVIVNEYMDDFDTIKVVVSDIDESGKRTIYRFKGGEGDVDYFVKHQSERKAMQLCLDNSRKMIITNVYNLLENTDYGNEDNDFDFKDYYNIEKTFGKLKWEPKGRKFRSMEAAITTKFAEENDKKDWIEHLDEFIKMDEMVAEHNRKNIKPEEYIDTLIDNQVPLRLPKRVSWDYLSTEASNNAFYGVA